MNRKQSHEPFGSYSQTFNPKGHQPSPYIELLQSKKNVYGYRYDTKNIRSFTNYVKPSQPTISSIFSQKSKPFKSISTQKVKVLSSTNEKKKRTRTEQAQQKMHQSMCIYPTISQKFQDQNPNKSLYYGQSKLNGQFQPSQYFQQLSGQKNKRKRHLSQNKHNYSQSQNNNTLNNFMNNTVMLQNLQINDIDTLINLIDNCVTQANEYIAYLSQKMADLKQQLIVSRAEAVNLQEQINKRDLIISQKDQSIRQLQKKISQNTKQHRKQNNFQVKNLLQIIQKLSEENERLKNQMQEFRPVKNTKYGGDFQKMNEKFEKQKEKEKEKDKDKERQKQKDLRRDYYNQIHSKIDILNISIDNNHTFHQGNSPSNNKQKVQRDTAKKYKQYKFIKPKGR